MDGRDNGAVRNAIISDYLREKEEHGYKVYKRKLQEVYDFGLSVGIVRDVLKAKTKFWQFVWFVLACTAIGVCIHEVFQLVTNYLSTPTNTRITYRVNSSIEFPFVTICTYARVNATKIRNQKINNDLMTYMLSAFKGMYLFYNSYNIRQRQEILEADYQAFLGQQFTRGEKFSLTKFFLENGFDCTSFLSSCMFQGTDFECCQQQPILSDIGKCFLVRSKQFPHQTIPGPSGGLKLYISNWKTEYPETMINSNPDMGVQIHILHPSSSAYIGVSPLIIFPGTHAMVRLKPVRQILKKSNKVDSCTERDSLKYFNSYSYEGCFTECIADMTEKTCGCVQIGSVPDYESLDQQGKICGPQSATSCVQPLLQANNMGFLWDIYDIKEKCDCPLPCKQWNYENSVSYSSVPNPGFKKAWDKLVNGGDNNNFSVVLSDDYMIVDIFFDNLVYQEIEEKDLQTYTIFLSNIGGQLSIWLGIRLITLVHLCYYGCMTTFYLLPVWFRKMRDFQSHHMQRATSVVMRRRNTRRSTNDMSGTVNTIYQPGESPSPARTSLNELISSKEEEALSGVIVRENSLEKPVFKRQDTLY